MLEKPKVIFDLEAFAQAEHYCYLAFKNYQAKQSTLDVLKSSEKDMLASIMCGIDTGDKIAESKLERLARASKDWRDFKAGLSQATRECGEARFKNDSARRHFDCIQSGLSFRREELKKLGGGQ